MTDHAASPPLAAGRGARPRPQLTAAAVTLGLALAGWFVAIRRMTGMDMGVATELGSAGSFAAMWMPMMSAMMLPGAVPAVVRVGGTDPRRAAAFVASYVGLWAAVGVAAYALYRPHGTVAAGVVVLVAAGYEVTPLKRRLRRRCRVEQRSGLRFGLCCLGSSCGLMAVLLALGVMNIAWMTVITVVVTAQKVLPLKTAYDMAFAVAVTGLGVAILLAPAATPGLTPGM